MVLDSLNVSSIFCFYWEIKGMWLKWNWWIHPPTFLGKQRLHQPEMFLLLTCSVPSTHFGGSLLLTLIAASGSKPIPDTKAMRSLAICQRGKHAVSALFPHIRQTSVLSGLHIIFSVFGPWALLLKSFHVPLPSFNLINLYTGLMVSVHTIRFTAQNMLYNTNH